MLAKRLCYCEKCKTEFNFPAGVWDDNNCPICGNLYGDTELFDIPDYETPAQYEKRTGKAYPDNGATFYAEDVQGHNWIVNSYAMTRYVKESRPLDAVLIVIASPPIPPPDGWKPEV